MELPENHQTIMPYLILEKAKEFGHFASAVFGAEITLEKLREDGNTLMHSELILGASTIMYADVTDQWQAQTANLFIYVPDADTTYHKAVELGATTVMELSDQSYGRTCGLKDPFGNTWWVTSLPPKEA